MYGRRWRRFRGVDLRLNPRLDDVKRACNHTGHSPSRRCSSNLEPNADIFTLNPLSRQSLFLLVEGELQGGEWQVSENSGLISVEKGGYSLLPNDGAGSVYR